MSESITIIGGSDGPTSVFLAGKIGDSFMTFGVCLLIAAVAGIGFIIWKRKK